MNEYEEMERCNEMNMQDLNTNNCMDKCKCNCKFERNSLRQP